MTITVVTQIMSDGSVRIEAFTRATNVVVLTATRHSVRRAFCATADASKLRAIGLAMLERGEKSRVVSVAEIAREA